MRGVTMPPFPDTGAHVEREKRFRWWIVSDRYRVGPFFTRGRAMRWLGADDSNGDTT